MSKRSLFDRFFRKKKKPADEVEEVKYIPTGTKPKVETKHTKAYIESLKIEDPEFMKKVREAAGEAIPDLLQGGFLIDAVEACGRAAAVKKGKEAVARFKGKNLVIGAIAEIWLLKGIRYAGDMPWYEEEKKAMIERIKESIDKVPQESKEQKILKAALCLEAAYLERLLVGKKEEIFNSLYNKTREARDIETMKSLQEITASRDKWLAEIRRYLGKRKIWLLSKR